MSRTDGAVRPGNGLTRRGLLRRGLGAIAGMGLLEISPSTTGRAATAAPPARGGTLVFATGAEALNLDPPYAGDGPSNIPTSMTYNNLVKFVSSTNLDTAPDLATSWKVDGTAWTFKLRRGVVFHDGTACDAHAVASHFNRLLGPEKPLRASLWVPFVDRVEALDDTTVRFTTKVPDPSFLLRMANSTGAVESPAAFAKYGKDLARHPVGTGPFKFQEWVQNEHITLVRNESYWGDKAHLDAVVIRPTIDPSARVIALTAGDVQLASAIPPEQVRRIVGDPRLGIVTIEPLATYFLGMNVLKKPFTDLRVRRALNHAVDKAAIIKNIFQGMGEVLSTPVPRGAAGFAQVPGFPYDPAKAKQLLAEAGYPNGFSSTMLVTNGTTKELEFEQFVQEQWAAIGVRVTLQPAEWNRYLELLRMPPTSSPLEMWLDSWAAIEAGEIIWDRFGCRMFRPVGQNTAGYCNEDLDDLLAQARRTLDQTTRDGVLAKAQALVSQQAPAVWMIQLQAVAGVSRRLHNPIFKKTGLLTVDEHTWLES